MTTKINGTNTVASPAITGDDVDTGVVYGNAQVDISIGGASKATVDSNGRLGIGTTSPSGLLHLSGDTCQLHFTDEDDSASSRIYQSGSTFAIDVDQADAKGSSVLQFRVDDAERMRIDSSGRVLIGTTTDNGFKFKVSDGGGYEFAFAPNDSGVNSLINYDRSGSAYVPFQVSGSDLRFCSGGNTQRMKILSTGQIHVGPHSTPFTTNTLFNIQRTNGMLFSLYHDGTDDNTCAVIKHQRSSGGTYAKMLQFNEAGGSAVGDIRSNGSATSYITSSDYRLKENVVAISDGITRLKTLKPSRFNFKVDKDTTVDGFLAHEVTAVPEAISGTKDGMKPETYYEKGDTLPSGKVVGDVKTYSSTEPEYQGIDQSKLVPLLTAALQEAIAKIETLETKVAALEAA